MMRGKVRKIGLIVLLVCVLVGVAVDIAIFLEYGYRVPDVATRVQENVKKAIESMTGLTVVEINVHVQGIHFPQTQVPEEKETRVK
jgi:uncharacterized alkaline shock family protein YloU